MSDEISLNKSWSIEAYVSHNESMRMESDRRYEQRFVAQEKAVEAALQSAQEAVLKAERASEERFKSVNEFRATLSDQATHFASSEKVNDLISRFDRLEGRGAGLNAGWIYLLGAITFIGGVVTILGAILAAALYVTNGKGVAN